MSSDNTYSGAPDECSQCWPHKLHKGLCRDECKDCTQEREYFKELSEWEQGPDWVSESPY